MRPRRHPRPADSFNLSVPSLRDPDLAPPGKHVASSFAFYAPIGADHATQSRLRDEMASAIVAKIATKAPNFRDDPQQAHRRHDVDRGR